MNLTLEQLTQIADLVGAVAIILSLIYLAIQVRQNTRSTRAQNYAHAHERVSVMQSAMATDPDVARLFARALGDPARLDMTARMRFSWQLYEMFGAFEFMYHQYVDGALREDVWQRWSDTLGWWLAWPGVQAWWHARPTPFSASFSAHVEELIRRGTPDPERARRFQEFLAQPVKSTPE